MLSAIATTADICRDSCSHSNYSLNYRNSDSHTAATETAKARRADTAALAVTKKFLKNRRNLVLRGSNLRRKSDELYLPHELYFMR
jgi:hypothetical protein